ncbi:MAG: hypothetical protein NTY53_06490 [Kiritimatiellaeota bacterium]|nr:hypothetical protein [Kiritimatiellota bacterium]
MKFIFAKCGTQRVSKPWKTAGEKFQALEKFSRDFPSLGKNGDIGFQFLELESA